MLRKIAQKNRLAQFYQTPEQLIHILPIPAVMIHRSGTLLYLNHYFAELYELTVKEMMGRKIQTYSDMMSKKIMTQFDYFDQGEDQRILEIFYEGRYYQMMLYPLFNRYNRVEAFYMLKLDVSQMKRLQQISIQNHKKSKAQLFLDPLTNTLNDYAIEELITQKKQRDSNDKVTVFLIQLDHFERFHAERGFVVANETLRHIAEVLKQELRSEDDVLAKLPGHRFLIMIPESTPYTAFTIAERLRNCIYQLNIQSQHAESQRLTISIMIDTIAISDIRSAYHLIDRLDRQLQTNTMNYGNRSILHSENQ